MEGFIQLHRKIFDWEWYDDINTKTLFIHLLLKANWRDKTWRGKEIKRGTLITGRTILSKETGLSEQQIRTSLRKLISTNEITIESTNSNSIIEIKSYNEYQSDNQQINQQNNQQVTTTNNINNNNIYKGGFTKKEILQELGRFISYWNSEFNEKRRVTQDLEGQYLIVRKKYHKEDIATAFAGYVKEKKQVVDKSMHLAPITFLKQNNGIPKYL